MTDVTPNTSPNQGDGPTNEQLKPVISPGLAEILLDEDRWNELSMRYERYPFEPRLDAAMLVFPELLEAIALAGREALRAVES